MKWLLCALRRITPRLLLLQAAGNAVLLLLAVACLQIPDSHAWQLFCSLLSGAVLTMGFLTLHSVTLRRLHAAAKGAPLWVGMLVLAGWVLLYWLLAQAAGHISDHAYLRAGYWNSQLGPHWRTVFTYDRLIAWQNDLSSVLVWTVLPALLLPLLVETVTRGLAGWRNGLRVLLRWQHWLIVIAASWLGCWLTSTLLSWHPAHSVRGELFSLALRLLLIYAIDLLLVLLMLATDAELLTRNDSGRDAAT